MSRWELVADRTAVADRSAVVLVVVEAGRIAADILVASVADKLSAVGRFAAADMESVGRTVAVVEDRMVVVVVDRLVVAVVGKAEDTTKLVEDTVTVAVRRLAAVVHMVPNIHSPNRRDRVEWFDRRE